MSRITVELPDGRSLSVAELHGAAEFEAYIASLNTIPSTDKPAKYFGLFARPVVKQTPASSHALYENGNHLAVYIFQPTATGLNIEHCAPTNGRAVTPEIRSILEKYMKDGKLLDVSSLQRGIYFDQTQDFIRPEQGESLDAFKVRALQEAVSQIEQYKTHHADLVSGLRK